MRVLVLEDDLRMSRAYALRLRADGHAVDQVGTLQEARSALMDADYDCLVLDRLVPDGDALELLDDVREGHDATPVLFVSALGDGEERVLALKAGADDYLAKPAPLDEIALRVRKLVARRTSETREPVRLGRVTVDRARRHVTIDGADVRLTPLQYAVLDYLVANRHRLVTVEELLEHCWDRNRLLFNNPLHSQICRLRKVFRGALRFELVRSAGYVLQPV